MRQLEAPAVGLFACAVFLGDVFLGVTVPAAILLLPFVLLVRIPTLVAARSLLSPGLILLSLVAVPVAAQTLLGHGPRGKTDLVLYLPLVYAGLTMAALAGAQLRDRHVQVSFTAGGVLATGLLIGTLAFADPTFYPVPGQNPRVTLERQNELRKMIQSEMKGAQPGVAPPELEPVVEPPLPNDWRRTLPYYVLKSRARTPLGMSNYLAVVFVFLFNVMLYQRSWWALLFAAMVCLTLSRSGAGFLLISCVFWTAHRYGKVRQLTVAGAVAAVFVALAVGVFWDRLPAIPGGESLRMRAWYLNTAMDPISAHPVVGSPRSELVRQFAYAIVWNPHNSVLHLLVLFGVVGTAAYAAYMAVVILAVRQRARESALWCGIMAGIVVALLWSLVEIVVLTPAFEILIASMYCLARGRKAIPAYAVSDERARASAA